MKRLFLLIFSAVAMASASAAPGDFDLSFNGSGFATTAIGGTATAKGIALQADGKMVVAGYATIGSIYQPALARYNTNGSLDTSFGVSGVVLTNLGNSGAFLEDVTIQADGKIIVAGTTYTTQGTAFLVMRYDVNGSLDSSFDGDGVSIVNVTPYDDVAFSVAIQSDGKIVAGGYARGASPVISFAAVRYNTDGSLDSNFGSAGKLTLGVGGYQSDTGLAMNLQSDNKILMTGYCKVINTDRLGIARLLPIGTMDSNFDGDGIVISSIGSPGGDIPQSIKVQNDGKIVVGGYTYQGGTTNQDLFVARFLPNGSPDSSFDGDGKVITTLTTVNDYGFDLSFQKNGKIFIVGSSGQSANCAVVRYHANGSLDTTFAGTGIKTLGLSSGSEQFYSTAITPDGRIVAAGLLQVGSRQDFLIARFIGDEPEIGIDQPAGAPLVDGTATVDFGVMATGGSIDRTFTITNSGNSNLGGFAFSFDGPHASEFQVVAAPPAEVGPGGSASFTVRMTAGGGGTRTATLRVASWDVDEDPFDIQLQGQGGGAPDIAVFAGPADTSPELSDGQVEPVDFGSVDAELATAERVFTLKNTGNLPLTIGSITAAAGFSVVSQPAAAIAPGGTAQLTLRFSPQQAIPYAGLVTISSNDPDTESEFAFAVTGTGVHLIPQEIGVAYPRGTDLVSGGPVLNMGRTAVNVAALAHLTVRTDGAPLTISGIHVTGAGFSLVDPPSFPLTIGKMRSMEFVVQLTSPAPLAAQGTFTLQSDDADEAVFTISLAGVVANAATNRSPVIWGRQKWDGRELLGAKYTRLSAGNGHTVALRSDGSVLGWGFNSSGQASPPPGLIGLRAIAAGNNHTLALKDDQTVVGWGLNTSGQTTVPVGLNDAKAIAAGNSHSVALKSDGTVVAWGSNSAGQTTVPAGLGGVVAVAAGNGASHTIALKGDGTVVAWGSNSSGQTTIPAGLSGVTAIAAGTNHSLALKRDGTVVAWGASSSGQTAVPAGLADVVAIAAGANHSVALKRDGTVVAWGLNTSGQTTVPAGLAGVQAIAAGGSHTLALMSDGSITAWGSNSVNQSIPPEALANLETMAFSTGHALALKSDGSVIAWGSNSSGQTTIPGGLSGVRALAAGNSHSAALQSDGTVVAWGSNSFGQITVPGGLSGVQSIAAAAGGSHTVVLKNDGTVVAWGLNTSGQATVPAGLSGIRAIAAGNSHTLALKNDGTVVAWGLNTSGQSTVPAGLTGVQAIAAGGTHSVALKNDGTVVAWGANGSGQTTIPAGLTNIQAIAAGTSHTVALKIDGTVVAWGSNTSFQTTTPAGLSSVTALTSGGDQSALLTPALGLPEAAAPEIAVHLGTLVSDPALTDNQTVAVDFGSTTMGTPAIRSFTITNTGVANLIISGINLPSGFQLVSGGPVFPAVLSTGGTATWQVGVGSLSGTLSGNMEIHSNDPDEAVFEIPLAGVVTMPPDIHVLAGADDNAPVLTDGDTVNFGITPMGVRVTNVFRLKNLGGTPLHVAALNLPGGFEHVGVFSPLTLGPGMGHNFELRFVTNTVAGTAIGAMAILSDDPDEGSFDLNLSGTVLSFTTDTDGDGLSDASEFQLGGFGYNWQVSQPALVDSLFDNANHAGLFRADQVHTLRLQIPQTFRDMATGNLNLTLDWKKSTNLTNFLDFPAPPGSAVSINPQGDVEFEFPSTDNAAFYRIEME